MTKFILNLSFFQVYIEISLSDSHSVKHPIAFLSNKKSNIIVQTVAAAHCSRNNFTAAGTTTLRSP